MEKGEQKQGQNKKLRKGVKGEPIESDRIKDKEKEMKRYLMMLSSDDPEKKITGAKALGELGVASEEVIEGLVGLLGDEDIDVRDATEQVLKNIAKQNPEIIGKAEKIIMLIKGLKECDSEKVSTSVLELL